MGKKLLLNMPEKDFRRIESLVTAGEFATRTDAVRFAIKNLLYNEERMKRFEDATRKLQGQTKKMGLTKKDIIKEIEESKERTRKLLEKRI